MAFVIADRVQETSTTAGTGTLSLAGAAAGYRSFVSGIGNGNSTYYTIYDPTALVWEVGIGTVTSGAPNTLSRTTVLSNSSGTTSPITLAGNAVNVWCDYPAGGAVYQDSTGKATIANGVALTAGAITFPDGTAQGTAVSLGMHNRFINGSMVFDQRNSGASVTVTANANAYLLDRWIVQAAQGSKMTAQQTPSVTETGYAVRVAAGFTNYLAITSSSSYAPLATDYFDLVQPIESINLYDLAWGTANAKTITISFWAYSSLTGTFSGSVTNSTGALTYVFNYSIPVANTWTYITAVVPGPTTGTWPINTTASANVRIVDLGSGSSYKTSTVGSWVAGNFNGSTGSVSIVGTNGATFYCTGAQFERGSTATPFEFRHYGEELVLCQRYYQTGQQDCVGIALSASAVVVNTSFNVTMRAVPTVTIAANPYTESPWFQTIATGSGVYSSSHLGANGSAVLLTGYTGLTAGNTAMVRGSSIFFSAEL